jgi:hypothetical protein
LRDFSLVIGHCSLLHPITPFPFARAGKGADGSNPKENSHQPKSPFQAREAWPFPAIP